MGDEDNLELTEFQGAEGQPPDAGQDASRPGNAKDLASKGEIMLTDMKGEDELIY